MKETPKDVIKSILQINFGEGRNTDSLSEHIIAELYEKDKLQEKGAALSRDVHDKPTQLALELIQNADDNEYADENKSRIVFRSTPDLLILQNNEKGFTKENVKALCGFGKSTKQHNSGYIGEKGIGFKSVFTIANRVCIFSNGYQFNFEDISEDPVRLTKPEWVEEIPDFVDPEQTNIVLHIRESKKDKISGILNILYDPTILLFLNKLNEIHIIEGEKKFNIKRVKKDGQIELSDTKGHTSKWMVYTAILDVPSGIKEYKRENVKKTKVTLAFPLNGKGEAKTDTYQQVFAFLPVNRFGFRFVIQADFLLSANREHIHDNTWNSWLIKSIAEEFVRAIGNFKKNDSLKYGFYGYLDFSGVETDIFKSLPDYVYASMKESECMLTESNTWEKPAGVLRCDEDIRDLLTNKDLKEILNLEHLSLKVKNLNKEIRKKLGIVDFSIDDLIVILKDHSEWLKKRDDQWFASLFKYLANKDLSDDQLEKIKKTRIIRLENNNLTSVKEDTVFRSLTKKDRRIYGFEYELRVMKNGIMEAINTYGDKEKDNVMSFLKELKIEDANPSKIISEHILTEYKNGNWKNKEHDILLSYIKYIKDNKDSQLLKDVRESIYLYTDKGRWKHPEECYLSENYENENDLETLFDSIDVDFVSSIYADNDKKAVKDWKNFFIDIGVNTGLRIVSLEKADRGKYLTGGDKKKLRENSKHTNDEISDDNGIEFLEKIIKDISKKQAILLIQLLQKLWKEKNLSKNKALCRLSYIWNYRNQYKFVTDDASWLHTLKTAKWVPTKRGVLESPDQVFIDTSKNRDVLGDAVSYLAIEDNNQDTDLIKYVGINAGLSTNNILDVLSGLVDKHSEDKSRFEKLYRFLVNINDADETEIRKKFSESALIFIPNARPELYHKVTDEMIWKNISNKMGSHLIYLESCYPEIRTFFIDRLKIREKPGLLQYSHVLGSISKSEKILEEDREVIWEIYKQLNRLLEDECLDSDDWITRLNQGQLFLTIDGRLRKNNNDIFVNDDKTLYELFKDEIYVLDLKENTYPLFRNFIKESGLRYLSKNVETRLLRYEQAVSDENQDLGNHVRNSIEYILRYLYHKRGVKPEDIKDIGARLKDIKVYVANKISVEYSIDVKGISRCKTSDKDYGVDIKNGRIVISDPSDIDSIALVVSKFICNDKFICNEIEDFLSNILKEQSGRIEHIMNTRSIGKLPNFDEKPDETSEDDEKTDTDKKDNRVTIFVDQKKITMESPLWEAEVEPAKASGPTKAYKESYYETALSSIGRGGGSNGYHGQNDETNKNIGKWGEEHVFETIKNELKERYPEAVEDATDSSVFSLRHHDTVKARATWNNRNGESGKHYDIKIEEGDTETFIEVKTTRKKEDEANTDQFSLTPEESRFMLEKGKNYCIYRVYHAGHSYVVKNRIDNPADLLLNNKLRGKFKELWILL